MYTPSTLLLSHLVAFAALVSAQGDSRYAASVLSAITNVDPTALASASANLESSVLSALAEPTADQTAIISNIESEISAVIYTIDQFTVTADPSLLSSIEAQASAVGLDFDFEGDIGQLTAVAAAEGPEETGSVGEISTTDVDPEHTSSLVVISATTSTTNADSGETSSLVVISAATSFTTSTSDNAADSSSSSDSMTSQADSTSAYSTSTAPVSTQAESSSSDAAAAASTSDNAAAAATSLPIAAVGAGLAILAML